MKLYTPLTLLICVCCRVRRKRTSPSRSRSRYRSRSRTSDRASSSPERPHSRSWSSRHHDRVGSKRDRHARDSPHRSSRHRSRSQSRPRSKDRVSSHRISPHPSVSISPDRNRPRRSSRDLSSPDWKSDEEGTQRGEPKVKSAIHTISKVLSDMTDSQHIPERTKSSLELLCTQLSIRPYRERALAAVRMAGLATPRSSAFKASSSLSNPNAPKDSGFEGFPLTEMVASRVKENWRHSIALKGAEDWDPTTMTPPPALTKLDMATPKPNFRESDYRLSPNSTLAPSALKNEIPLSRSQSSQPVRVPLSKLEEWEKTQTTSLSLLNMLEIFNMSIGKRLEAVWDVLATYSTNTLPPDIQELLVDREKIKADQASQARALEHLTSLSAWSFGEMVNSRRTHVLRNCDLKLSEASTKILRSQPYDGPWLFKGRADELLQRDADQATSSVMLKLQSDWQKKPGAKPNQATKQSAQGTSTRQPFRRNPRGRGRATSFRRNFQGKQSNTSSGTKPSGGRGQPKTL